MDLDHPVIDGDGHLIEYLPLVRDFVAEEAGEAVAQRLDALLDIAREHRALSPEQRRRMRVTRGGWWAFPTRNTLDRATAMIPDLMYQRLDELRIDFALAFPSYGLLVPMIDDEELRRALARACNRYYAEVYGPYRDRLEPVAIIPTHTPGEALAELDYAIGTLGLKAVVMSGHVLRPFEVEGDGPRGHWVDTLAHDSMYDYDPVWQRCLDLRVAPTFHGGGYGWGSRSSTKNYVFNHVGAFASAQEAACRSIVLGGVAARFPDLRFGFLEGGAAWAATLYADLVGHWEKRNADGIRMYDPAELDVSLLKELLSKHASQAVVDRLDRLEGALRPSSDPDERPEDIDEFAESGIAGPEDITAMFRERFFFGCEADDPMTAVAFDPRLPPVGERLRPIFASDIGHWDVPDASRVMDEAWEFVEEGYLDEEAFRAFTFDNAVDLWVGVNPEFFEGTVVADRVGARSASA